MGAHIVTTGPMYLARAMGPPKASNLLFVGGSMAFGVCTDCSFPPSTGQKWKILSNFFLIL